jgi:hypothetical protein
MGHIIQKQLFSLSAPDMKQAREWEGKLHSIIHRVINPCIEKFFNEVSTGDKQIIVEKLEIDLGALNKKNFGELEENVTTQLRSQFEKHSVALIHNKSGTKDGANEESIHKSDVQQLNRHQKHYTCFVHFIKHGTLPWWAETETVNFEDGWINNLSNGEANNIALIFSEQPQLLDRLVYQFSEDFFTDLINQYRPQESQVILQSWRSVAIYYSLTIDNGKLHKHYWKFWIEKSFGISTEVTSSNLRTAMTSWLKSLRGAITQLLQKNSAGCKISDGSNWSESRSIVSEELFPTTFVRTLIDEAIEQNEELKSWLPPLTGTQYPNKETQYTAANVDPRINEHNAEDATITDELDTTNRLRSSLKPARIQNKNYPSDRDHELPMDKEGMFVSGAGVVLLHPFLTELFSSAGLWSKAGWASEISQHQAAQMIAFIAFGNTDLPEYEMSLPKVMTNIPVSEPLDMRIDLPEKYQRLAEELLTAVIGHWTAIGNTSIDGLREGFIQRQGKLFIKDDNWHLTVESKTQDILLNRLPWGISFIHLPWLAPSTLQVKWTT